jgi:diaminopimelate decarboxylase
MIDRDLAAGLAERFGTPLYLYDAGCLEARARALLEAVPRGSRILYSFKANPLPAVAEVLRRAGCDAEVSSAGELAAALAAGYAPGGLLFTGPGKTEEELAGALETGVRRFSCESWTELERLDAAAARLAATAEVLLRINPEVPPRARLAMGGGASRFGFEPPALAGRGVRLRGLRRLRILGVHVYHGTQIPAESLAATFESGLRLAEELAEALDLDWRIVDLGGGFPWPFAAAGEGPGAGELRGALAVVAGHSWRRPAPEAWFESGRFLAASSGTLVTRVLDVRDSGGKRFVIVDAGINHLGGMSGLGRLARPDITFQPVRPGEPAGEVDVVGPLCTPLDVLACGARLPDCDPGDLLCVPNTGAYGLTASLVGFLSRRPPAEVVHREGSVLAVHRLRHGYETAADRQRDYVRHAQP